MSNKKLRRPKKPLPVGPTIAPDNYANNRNWLNARLFPLPKRPRPPQKEPPTNG